MGSLFGVVTISDFGDRKIIFWDGLRTKTKQSNMLVGSLFGIVTISDFGERKILVWDGLLSKTKQSNILNVMSRILVFVNILSTFAYFVLVSVYLML